ncbi:unnamed protein product [Arctogadus glacialis]
MEGAREEAGAGCDLTVLAYVLGNHPIWLPQDPGIMWRSALHSLARSLISISSLSIRLGIRLDLLVCRPLATSQAGLQRQTSGILSGQKTTLQTSVSSGRYESRIAEQPLRIRYQGFPSRGPHDYDSPEPFILGCLVGLESHRLERMDCGGRLDTLLRPLPSTSQSSVTLRLNSASGRMGISMRARFQRQAATSIILLSISDSCPCTRLCLKVPLSLPTAQDSGQVSGGGDLSPVGQVTDVIRSSSDQKKNLYCAGSMGQTL